MKLSNKKKEEINLDFSFSKKNDEFILKLKKIIISQKLLKENEKH